MGFEKLKKLASNAFDAQSWENTEFFKGAENARVMVNGFSLWDAKAHLASLPPDWPNGHWVRGYKAYLEEVTSDGRPSDEPWTPADEVSEVQTASGD